MVPLALGTDGGGSIRIPCAFCGLPGPQADVRPRAGLAREPVRPASRTSARWPARSPTWRCCSTSMAAARRARLAAAPAGRGSFGAGLDDGVAGLRIAFSPELGYAAVDPEVAGLVARGRVRVRRRSARTSSRSTPASPTRARPSTSCGRPARRARSRTLPQRGRDRPGPGGDRRAGPRALRPRLPAACGERDELAIAMSRFHETWDLLLTPAMPIAAFEAGREVPDGSADPRWPGWTPFTYPFNLTQQPAATRPVRLHAAGLPAGLQIVGPRHADALVLRAARGLTSRRTRRLRLPVPIPHRGISIRVQAMLHTPTANLHPPLPRDGHRDAARHGRPRHPGSTWLLEAAGVDTEAAGVLLIGMAIYDDRADGRLDAPPRPWLAPPSWR